MNNFMNNFRPLFSKPQGHDKKISTSTCRTGQQVGSDVTLGLINNIVLPHEQQLHPPIIHAADSPEGCNCS